MKLIDNLAFTPQEAEWREASNNPPTDWKIENSGESYAWWQHKSGSQVVEFLEEWEAFNKKTEQYTYHPTLNQAFEAATS